MQRQCRSWMTDLRSFENEMSLLKEMVMDHAADLEDKNELLRFRYNAGLLNSELGEEARELIDNVSKLENMINYEIEEKMTVSIEDINLDHLNIKRRFNDFSSEYMDVKDELHRILGSTSASNTDTGQNRAELGYA